MGYHTTLTTLPYSVSPLPSGESACRSSVVTSVNAPVGGTSMKVTLGVVTQCERLGTVAASHI